LPKYYVLLTFLIIYTANAKEHLYTHIPSNFPSQNINTSFGKELIKLIDNSTNEISFAIYGLRGQDEIFLALQRAKERGVRIQGVVDSDTHGKNYYNDTDKLYESFGVVSDHKSYIMHNKFFIIDRKTLWSGSANISDTGTGGYNANNAVVTDEKKVVMLYQEEFDEMYHDKKFSSKKSPRELVHLKTKESIISVYFSPKSNTYEKGIKSLIVNAKDSIYIPIFYLTHKELSQDLIEAKKRGVTIKILLDASAAQNRYSTHHDLRENGIAIKVENFGGKMHCKSMIIDESHIISGSMNFTKAGNSKNDENTLIIKNASLALAYKNYFLALWHSIPDKYLHFDPSPESFESINSCTDGIDNDFDHLVDAKDKLCNKET